MGSLKALSFIVSKSHPSFKQARFESKNAKLVKNSIIAITRNFYFWNRDGKNADLTISRAYGIDVTDGSFSYSKNRLSLASVVRPVREIVSPKLHSKIVQGIAREVGDAWSSYWSLRKNNIKANIPGYSKNEYGTVPYNFGMIAKRDYRNCIIRPTSWAEGFVLPEYARGRVQSMELVPVSCEKFVLRVYYKPDESVVSTSGNLVAGLDFGIGNLMTVAYSDCREGFIVSGKPIVDLLCHYNGLIDGLISKNDIKRGGESRKSDRFVPYSRSKRVDGYRWKANVRIKNYYTLVNNLVVKRLQDAGVGVLVIGWSDDFKHGCRLGRFTNRKFMGIPHAAIRDDLMRKCEQAGIAVVITEESYTSKSSWLDDDDLPVFIDGAKSRHKFSGRRVSRGLYRSRNGRCINADVNGALNIIKKYIPGFSPSSAGIGSVVPRARRLDIPVVW